MVPVDELVATEELVDGTEELVFTLEEVLVATDVATEDVVATEELVFTLEEVVATELEVVGQPFTTP